MREAKALGNTRALLLVGANRIRPTLHPQVTPT